MTLARRQIEARASRVGASELPSLTGTSRYGSPATVYDRLIGTTGPMEQTTPMRVGIYLERHVLILSRDIFGLLSTPCWRAYVHKGGVPMTASPDAYAKRFGAYGAGLVEVKVTSSRWNGVVPLYVIDQVQAQMGLTGRPYCHVAVLSGSSLDVITVPFDQARYEYLEDTVRRFDRDHLQPRIRPPEPNPLIVGATNK